jgi:DNA polymerase-3 subunit gamma/tau
LKVLLHSGFTFKNWPQALTTAPLSDTLFAPHLLHFALHFTALSLPMTQALYRKWRPRLWDQVVGQDHIVQTLQHAVAGDRVAHAYLFAGPRGTGKTTTARLLAKAVNCLDADLASRPCDQCEHCRAVNEGRFLDLIEIDAASNTSVEDVRDLRDKINFSPNLGRYKVYLVDEVHMLSTAAFNALLKTLEEPPAHAIFILATTEIHKIPATVLSRCQRHEFRRIPIPDIIHHLDALADGEGLQVEPEALTLVARQATGSLRDAISLLDQLASAGQSITLDIAQTVLGTATTQSVLEVLEALLASDSAAGLDHIHRALDSGSDPRQFARQIVDYLRGLLLVRLGNVEQVDATAETRAVMARHAQALPTADLLRVIKAFNQAAVDARAAWQPALPLEMAFVEALEKSQPATPAEAPIPEASHPPQRTSTRSQARPVAPEAPTGPPADASANQQLADQWREIVSLVKQRNANTAALLNSIKTRDLREDVLTLGFASDVLKSHMEKPANVQIVEEALHQVLGEPVHLRSAVVSGKRAAPPPDVPSDGMVAAALRDLGGEIVDVQ